MYLLYRPIKIQKYHHRKLLSVSIFFRTKGKYIPQTEKLCYTFNEFDFSEK